MKDVEHEVHKHLTQKHTDNQGDEGNGFQPLNAFNWTLLFVFAVFITASMFLGYFVAGHQNYMAALEEVPEASNQYVIEDYKITFLSDSHREMSGRTIGFTQNFPETDIYIEKGLSLDQAKSTCEHELMHNLGIGSEHHDYVYENDVRVSSSVCRSLKKKLVYENRTDLVKFT